MKSIVREVSVIFTDMAKIIFLMQKARLYYLEIARFRHVTFTFCIILDILDNALKFLFLLITLTIPLLSPRNYSFTTFLASEKIK